MKPAALARRWTRITRDVLFPPQRDQTPADQAQRARADEAWALLFQPFGQAVQGLDILEIGCGDGRMLAALIDRAGARSGVGVAATPDWDKAPAWNWKALAPRLRLKAGSGQLEGLKPRTFDLILVRDLEGAFGLADLEAGLSRLYALLRPGGEAWVRVRCASATDVSAGFGFLTPSSWTALIMRAGFEIIDARRAWLDPAAQAPLVETLKGAGDAEALVGEMVLRLARPWEAEELADMSPARRR